MPIFSLSIYSGESITVGISTYDQAGTYYDTLTNSQGCDSIITSNLTVNELLNMHYFIAEKTTARGKQLN